LHGATRVLHGAIWCPVGARVRPVHARGSMWQHGAVIVEVAVAVQLYI
jgi:hypothetical protein